MFAPGSLSLRPESRVTDRDRKRFMKVFESCDQGKKGYLTREDLKVAVVMLFGYKPSKLEVNSMMSSLQPANETTGVTLDVFVRMMSTKKAAQLSFGDHRQIFSAFDAHCCGFLTVEDFKRAFKHVSPHLPEQTVLEAFSFIKEATEREVIEGLAALPNVRESKLNSSGNGSYIET